MKLLKDRVHEFWEQEALPALVEFGKIPNVSPAFDNDWKKAGHMDRAANLVAEWVRSRGIADTVIIQQAHGRTPLVYVDIKGSVEETVLIYGHFDKQPELTGWREGLSPWNPVREGDYLYGRGLADDGYAVFAALGAIEIAKKSGANLPRIVLLIEGSEESGSEDLPFYLELLKDEIGNPKTVITLDAEGWDMNHLWLTESLRGLVNGYLKIETLESPLHSGLATGVVPSVFRIARLLLDRLEDARTVYSDDPIQSGIGASIPFIGMMARAYPNADQLVTGILSPASNAHGPNENLHIPTVKNITEWLSLFLQK